MNAYQEAPSLETPSDILAECTLVQPHDDVLIHHPFFKRFGNPKQAIHIDETNVELGGIQYETPILLPMYDKQLELIQCAVMQDCKPVSVIPNGVTKGFAYFGELTADKPVIIARDVEGFFKIAQTGYAVVLVITPKLCNKILEPVPKPADLEAICLVVNQLRDAGFNQLYMPVRPENKSLLAGILENTNVRLIEQFTDKDSIDLSQYDDVRDVKLFLDGAIRKLPVSTYEWGNLIPFTADTAVINRYPIAALPSLAREAIEAIAEHVQSPIAMTAQCVIGAMSHIAQSKVNAPHPFNPCGEPCSLFLLTEGQSGSRKSTSRGLADKAIYEHERKQYEIYRADLEQWKSGYAGLPKKDREAYQAENPPPIDPSSLFSDITLESIAGLFIDGVLQNASIASDEAGQFFGGHTMKADTRNQALGGYAKLFDDGFVERTRSKANLNGSGRAYDVRLTFNLQGQHEVLADALKDPVLRGQGFLPRFILTIPENLAGTRLQDAVYQNQNASTDHRLTAYWSRCEYLLDSCPQVQTSNELHSGRYVIPMDEQAKRIDLEFYNLFESLQGKGKQYEYLQAFASRASQLARRLATVFAYFEGLQQIDAKTLKGACEVVKHSLSEWAMYADIEVKIESNAERLAKFLVRKCRAENTDKIAKSVALQSAPSKLRKVRDFDASMQELIANNYVRLRPINQVQYIELNPSLLK